MGRGDEYLAKEAAAWAAFEPRLRSGEGLAFDWSHAQTAGHLAFWLDRCASRLEAEVAGPVSRADWAIDIDAVNDEHLPIWDKTPVEESLAAVDAARARLLGAWTALGDGPSDAAAGWFKGDTYEHYDEHMEA
jgi:hypothetical protein